MSSSLDRSRLRRKFAPLSAVRTAADAALFVRVIGVATAVPVMARLPLPRLATLLSAADWRRRQPECSPSDSERIARYVDVAQHVAGPLVRRGCLTRSVTLYWFLRRAGVDVELVFGIGKLGDDSVAAHCWVARGGDSYLEPAGAAPAPRFEAIYRIPVTRR